MIREAFDNFFGKTKLEWTLGEQMIITGAVFIAIGVVCAIVYGICMIIEWTKNKRSWWVMNEEELINLMLDVAEEFIKDISKDLRGCLQDNKEEK